MSFSHAQPASPEAAHPGRWLAMSILLLASFMNLIDVTIVNVALPRLQQTLNAGSSEIEWVVAAYVLAFALGLLPFGRLGDMIGRKRMFLAGVACFTLFSAVCGMAPTARSLIVARVFQGLAGAMMMPQVLAIAQTMFPPQERGFAFSLFGLTAGLASVAGPLTGGLLIGADLFGLDWRPIFLVNLPIGIAALAAGAALIPTMPGHPDLTHDLGAIPIAAVSVFLVVFPLIEGHVYGWPAWTFAMLAFGIAGIGIFYFYEQRRAAANRTQLLPVALMSNSNFMLGATVTMIYFSGIAGFFLVLAVFLQTGFGLTPLQSGLTTVPFPAGVFLASLVAGRIGSSYARERIVVGASTLLLGMIVLRFTVDGVGDVFNHWRFLPPLAIAGIGMGIGVSGLFQTALAGVPHRDAGSASGALQSFQQIGSALGIAITGQIFFSTLQEMASADPHPTFVLGLEQALIYEMVAFAVVALMALLLKKPPVHHGGRPAAPQSAEA